MTIDNNQQAHHFIISKHHLQKLEKMCLAEDCSPSLVLQAVFHVLLYRQSNQVDTVTFASYQPYTSYQPYHISFTKDLTFRQLLTQFKSLQQNSISISTNNISETNLVSEMFPDGENSAFRVKYTYTDDGYPEETLSGCILHLLITEKNNHLEASMIYHQDYCETWKIKILANQFLIFLSRIADDLEQAVSTVSLLTEIEENQVLFEWNDTLVEYDRDTSIHKLIEDRTLETPEARAVIFEERSLSLLEVNNKANQLAHYLKAIGVKVETLVGICMDRSCHLFIGLLGVLKAGGAYVPINPEFPRQRKAVIINDAQFSIILTESKYIDHLPECSANIILLDELLEGTYISDYPKTNLDSGVCAENLAMVLYTSGSTGVPKGVMLTHRNVTTRFQCEDRIHSLAPDALFAQTSSLSFVDHMDEIFWPPINGIPTLIIPQEIVKDPYLLIETLEKYQATHIHLVPSLLWMILNTLAVEENPLPKLTEWLVGGEALPSSLVQEFNKKLPHAKLENGYGATETTSDTTVFDTSQLNGLPYAPIGKAIDNVTIYILDQQLQPVPVNILGELYIGGTSIARGYLNRPDLSAERFIPNPFSDHPDNKILWKSGDIGRFLPDGNIEYVGRADHQIKIRGIRVESGEIEMFINQYPGVKDSLVVGKEHQGLGTRLIAYVIPAEGYSLEDKELRNFLKDYLPDYAVPAVIIFLKEFPLTPHGKVDRKALPEPERSPRQDKHDYAPPETTLEKQLAQIWESLLGGDAVSIDDNFFDIGGDSLLAVTLFIKIEKLLGKYYPISILINACTIRELAAVLEGNEAIAGEKILVPIQPHGSRSPLFMVHADGGILFYERFTRFLPPDQPLYGIQALGLKGIDKPFFSVQEMAAQYIREIKSVQPTGPYYLGSYSLGAYILIEMGQQLMKNGDEIGLLGFIDTHGKGYPELESVWKQIAFKISTQLAALESYNFMGKLKYLWRRICKRTRIIFSRLFASFYVIFKLSPPHNVLYNVVRAAIYKAVDQYEIPCYTGKITLFRATLQPVGAKDDPGLGWAKFVDGEIEVCDIEGSHNSIMREPHLGKLVDEIVKRVRK
jgi:aspartate racemase